MAVSNIFEHLQPYSGRSYLDSTYHLWYWGDSSGVKRIGHASSPMVLPGLNMRKILSWSWDQPVAGMKLVLHVAMSCSKMKYSTCGIQDIKAFWKIGASVLAMLLLPMG
jgi:hypothetical protein